MKKEKSKIINFTKYSDRIIENLLMEDYGSYLTNDDIKYYIKEITMANPNDEMPYLEKYNLVKLLIIAEQIRLEMQQNGAFLQ